MTQFFLGVLPFSSYIFGEFVLDQKLPTFIAVQQRMFAYFGGVYQTAWQVKVHQDPLSADVTCQTPLTDILKWPEAKLPSAARLTTTTVAVTTEPDPCLVPPSGGYRGLENHLYRVEIHAYDDAAKAAHVKWSRENAHVATNVLEILSTGKTIRVESFGARRGPTL